MRNFRKNKPHSHIENIAINEPHSHIVNIEEKQTNYVFYVTMW